MGLEASANVAKEVAKACKNGLLGGKRFKFSSQICTSREQSERLLSLGLKKETADMIWTHAYYGTWVVTASENPLYEESESVPAWSLHRLIEMMPENPTSDDWLGVSFDDVSYYHGEGEGIIGWKYYRAGNLYDCIIECYEWLIKEGYFNKEYLENQAEIDEHCKGVLEYLDYIRDEKGKQ